MDSEKWYCEARKLLTKLYGQPYRIALACAVLVTKGSAIKSEDGAIILGETCSSSSNAKKLIFLYSVKSANYVCQSVFHWGNNGKYV